MSAVALPQTTQVQDIEDTVTEQVAAVAPTVASQVARLLRRAGALETGRIMLFEPRTCALARHLRRAGFRGEIHVVSQLREPVTSISRWADTSAQIDWAELTTDNTASDDVSDDVSENAGMASLAGGGEYDAVIVENVERVVAREQIPRLLPWLASRTAPRGYLGILHEAGSQWHASTEALLRAGCLLSRDVQQIHDSWTWTFAIYQRWPAAELHLAGRLDRYTLAELTTAPQLDGLVETYREVFSGDDWQEWVRCVDPACGKQYSKEQLNGFVDPERCPCGCEQALIPFHSSQSIVAKLSRELKSAASCCYLAVNDADGVDGFSWGYITSVEPLVTELLEGLPARATTSLGVSVQDLIHEVTGSVATEDVYYHSEIGIAGRARGSSLFRWLCLRVLETVDDQGAHVVLARTSRASSAYPMLLGVGMRQLFAYDEGVPQSDLADLTRDQRVILGGNVQEMLRIFSQEPDLKLVIRNTLKRVRQGG